MTKKRRSELFKLIEHRLGLKIDPTSALESVRVRTARYVLINEFRDDLSDRAAVDAPDRALGRKPPSSSPWCARWPRPSAPRMPNGTWRWPTRSRRSSTSAKLAIAPEHLGRVDTFRFEEKVLLSHARSLIARGQYDPRTRSLPTGSAASGSTRRGPSASVDRVSGDGRAGTDRQGSGDSAREDGERPDRLGRRLRVPGRLAPRRLAQRNLEALILRIDEEPESEPALQRVRQAYEELLQKMAVGFTQVLKGAGWSVPKTLPQTRIYPELVEKAGSRVAYFLVDALRFEMGVELKNLLTGSEDLVLRPAIAALPTITPVGMAALLPGASASFDVVEASGALVSRIEGTALKDLTARMKFLKARVPGAVDIELGKLLQLTSAKLKNAIGDARLVVVRSQEIDKFGEMDGDCIARQMMDTVLQNVARAVRKLAGAGIDSVVIAADHGYQFTREKDEAFRTDNPGGSDDRPPPPLLDRTRGLQPAGNDPRCRGGAGLRHRPGFYLPHRHRGLPRRGQSCLPSWRDQPAGDGHPGPHPCGPRSHRRPGVGRRLEPEGRAEGREQPHVRRDHRTLRPVRREPVCRAAGPDGGRGASR